MRHLELGGMGGGEVQAVFNGSWCMLVRGGRVLCVGRGVQRG